MDKLRELNPLHERYGYASLIVVGAAVLAISGFSSARNSFCTWRQSS